MKQIALMAAALALAVAAQAKDHVVTSPDGAVVVTVSAAENVTYSVDRAGVRLLDPSRVSMTLQDGTVFGRNDKFRVSRRSVDVTVPAQNFKRASVRDHYNELTLSAKRYDIVFRAYDDGIAWRFVAKGKKGETVVTAEQAEFAFAGDWNLYVPYGGTVPPSSPSSSPPSRALIPITPFRSGRKAVWPSCR